MTHGLAWCRFTSSKLRQRCEAANPLRPKLLIDLRQRSKRGAETWRPPSPWKTACGGRNVEKVIGLLKMKTTQCPLQPSLRPTVFCFQACIQIMYMCRCLVYIYRWMLNMKILLSNYEPSHHGNILPVSYPFIGWCVCMFTFVQFGKWSFGSNHGHLGFSSMEKHTKRARHSNEKAGWVAGGFSHSRLSISQVSPIASWFSYLFHSFPMFSYVFLDLCASRHLKCLLLGEVSQQSEPFVQKTEPLI